MGRSIEPFTELPRLPSGTVLDKHAGAVMTAAREHGRMVHTLSHDGLSESYAVSWAVGADVIGYTFLVQDRSWIFQSPVSWYRQKRAWDVTPTYELDASIDLDRPAVSGCLFCHAGSARAIPDRTDQFEPGSLTAISCERCHGPSEKHLSSPVPGSIVNPAKLNGPERDSICEQCHLEGEVRILNPGHGWWDFRAGQKQEDVFVTFVRSRSERGTKAVSQAEQLADSRCARESGGRLWCVSCHDPHGERTTAASVRKVCMSCHADLFAENRHQPAGDCLPCHMAKLRADNVAHAAVTDHTIPRLPGNALEPRYGLRAWREPDASLRDRDMGLAMINAGSERRDGALMKDGYNLLAGWYRAYGTQDPDVMSALGSVLLDMNEADPAASLFRAASSLQPSRAEDLYGLALALNKQGHADDAIAELRRAIAVDPSYRNAYLMLAQIYADRQQPGMRTGVIEDYLRFMPESILFREMLGQPH